MGMTQIWCTFRALATVSLLLPPSYFLKCATFHSADRAGNRAPLNRRTRRRAN